MELRARLNKRPSLVHWLIAVSVVAGPRLGVAAPALDVHVECRALHPDSRAAFEARTRAELAVRDLDGSVALTCGSEAKLLWTPSAGASRSIELPMQGLDEHVLMEALAELLGERPASSPTTDVPVVDAPDEPADEPPGVAPPAASTVPDDAATAPTPEASDTTPAGEEAGAPPAIPAAPHEQPSAASPAQEEHVHPAQATEPTEPGPRWSVRAGLPTSMLADDVALGVQLGASIHLRPRLALLAEASAQQVVTPIEDYTLRLAEFRAGAALDLMAEISVYASVGAGLVLVEAPAGRALTPNGGPCQFAGRSGSCGFIGGTVGAQWQIGSGPLRPQLAAQIDWNHRELPIDETRPSGTTSRTANVPHVRPAVIFRIAWVDVAR